VSNGVVAKIAAKDVAPSNRQGGEIKALLTPTSVGSTAGFTGTQSIPPGEHIAEHYHPYSDEFVYVVRGTVHITVDGAQDTLEADEAIMFRRGQRHRLANGGTEPAFLVYHISPLAPKPELGHVDTEHVPNPDSRPPQVGGQQ
jgi:putative monooxygenase